MSAEIREVDAVLCQIGTAINQSAWVTVPWLECMSFDEGSGQTVGSATFRHFAGVRTAINQGNMQQVGELPGIGDPSGKLVRILKRDDNGTVSIGEDSWTPAWHGQITTRAIQLEGKTNNQNGAIYEYQAIGVLSLLEQFSISRGFYGVAPVEHCPAFNAGMGTWRSATSGPIGGVGSNAFPHSETSEIPWTAADILENLLVVHTSGLFTIADPDNCLDYVPTAINLHGATLLQAFMELAGPKRGLTYFAQVNASNITIVVVSTSAYPISVGTFTLPASTISTELNIAGKPFYIDPVVTFDHTAVFDEIEIIGAHPITMLTIPWSMWDKGWSPTEETAWNDNPTSAQYAHVWRRFVVNNQWRGANTDNISGLRDLLNLAIDNSYGYNGRTGQRFFSNPDVEDDSVPEPSVYTVEPNLTFAEGYTASQAGTRSGPVFVVESNDENIDVIGTYKWGVTLGDKPLSVTFNDGKNGLNIQAIVDNLIDSKFYFTIALREIKPLKVSWVRNPNEQPRIYPRKKTILMSGAEQWYVCDGCVLGVDENGARVTQSGDELIRDDVPAMRNMLALFRKLYATPRVNFKITNRAIIDTSSSTRPGTLLTSITTGNGTQVINGIITRRRYTRAVIDGVPMWHTMIEGESVVPELQAVL